MHGNIIKKVKNRVEIINWEAGQRRRAWGLEGNGKKVNPR